MVGFAVVVHFTSFRDNSGQIVQKVMQCLKHSVPKFIGKCSIYKEKK